MLNNSLLFYHNALSDHYIDYKISKIFNGSDRYIANKKAMNNKYIRYLPANIHIIQLLFKIWCG